MIHAWKDNFVIAKDSREARVGVVRLLEGAQGR